MPGGEAAGEWLVAHHRVAERPERVLGGGGDAVLAGIAETVAEHEIRAAAPGIRVERPADRRHRMAIDQHADPEFLDRLLDQCRQRLVVRPVVGVDAMGGGREGQLGAVDLAPVGDHLGDRAEAGGDTARLRVGVARQRVDEHRRVELERLAVGIDEGARKQGLDQGRAELGRIGEQLVDEAVLGAPQRHGIERGGGDEILGIDAPAMGRGEHQRHRLTLGPQNLEGLVGHGGRLAHGTHRPELKPKTRRLSSTVAAAKAVSFTVWQGRRG